MDEAHSGVWESVHGKGTDSKYAECIMSCFVQLVIETVQQISEESGVVWLISA